MQYIKRKKNHRYFNLPECIIPLIIIIIIISKLVVLNNTSLNVVIKALKRKVHDLEKKEKQIIILFYRIEERKWFKSLTIPEYKQSYYAVLNN